MKTRIYLVLFAAVALPLAAFTAIRWRPSDETNSPMKQRIKPGREIALVFVGASFCNEANNPGLPRGVNAFRDSVSAAAKLAGKNLVMIGVSIDDDPATGNAFLSRIGKFDEVLVGGGWLNTGAVQYMVRGVPGRLIVPQLIVVERDVEANGNILSVGRDSLVTRVLGGDIVKLGERSGTSGTK